MYVYQISQSSAWSAGSQVPTESQNIVMWGLGPSAGPWWQHIDMKSAEHQVHVAL